jgi:ABC-type phosphate/phosphonate transport system substrate-binding protein
MAIFCAGLRPMRGWKRFIETTDEDYLPIYQYTKELNLDLATYDFGNE